MITVSVKVNFDLTKLSAGAIHRRTMINASQDIKTQASVNAPYKTGNLSQSIGIEPSPFSITEKTDKVNI